MIQQKMQQCGIRNMSAYLRKMAIDGLVVNLDMPAFREMLKLMNRTAANVNQIAVRCNMTGGISREDLTELRDGYREQAEQIKKMVSEVITLKSIRRTRHGNNKDHADAYEPRENTSAVAWRKDGLCDESG